MLEWLELRRIIVMNLVIVMTGGGNLSLAR
jgi:hypothetical protein